MSDGGGVGASAIRRRPVMRSARRARVAIGSVVLGVAVFLAAVSLLHPVTLTHQRDPLGGLGPAWRCPSPWTLLSGGDRLLVYVDGNDIPDGQVTEMTGSPDYTPCTSNAHARGWEAGLVLVGGISVAIASAAVGRRQRAKLGADQARVLF